MLGDCGELGLLVERSIPGRLYEPVLPLARHSGRTKYHAASVTENCSADGLFAVVVVDLLRSRIDDERVRSGFGNPL